MKNAAQIAFETLHAFYGDLNWWPAKTPYEIIVGAILTQNTAWHNVEKALANFGEDFFARSKKTAERFVLDCDLHESNKIIHAEQRECETQKKTAERFVLDCELHESNNNIPAEQRDCETQKKTAERFVLDCDIDELKKIIRPAGFFNQKAVYLKAVTNWFAKYNFDVAAVRREPPEKLRRELLAVKGVGKETADSILLYAFGFATFVVDAYTIRLCERLPLDSEKNYDAAKIFFEKNLPRDEKIFNNFHALIVINSKNFCRKSKPLCEKCPLEKICAHAKKNR
ncbi:MAG: hypothetical protein FWD19_05915 [Defluviitaleaceae bacterium]|nr:hypothetical protein [Defluviitaleaceae bacterium]